MAHALKREAARSAVKSIAIAGGGTGGHVFPALAVAEEIARLTPAPLFWIGSSKGMERAIVEGAGIEFKGIPAGKLRRYASLKNLTDLLLTAAGIVSSFFVMARRRPAVLFSKGGYVSVPPVIAASLLRIPCFTHESDCDPGLATRINLRFCERIFISFPETLEYLPAAFRGKAEVTGNPVRSDFRRGNPEEGRSLVGCPNGRPIVLVLGGSLGSSAINTLVSDGLPALLESCFVVHQTGPKEFAPSGRAGYYTAAFFREELPHIMAAADLIVGRSGANALAELAALGKPSVLIPLPKGGTSRGDQIRNAEYFRARGAALVLDQQDATGEKLSGIVADLLGDSPRLRTMGLAAQGLGGGNSAEAIARRIVARLDGETR
jgi:UDP-N-acetylglucosamine--N-acetylmuramyl-(pentapeptide) pyrophosphoryl-undecaprenol N-acetylglucosamine transferase